MQFKQLVINDLCFKQTGPADTAPGDCPQGSFLIYQGYQ